MAPSNMFSYLRPGHNKRNASSTSLASPDPPYVTAPPLPSPSLYPSDSFPSPRIHDHASYASASPVSPFPPQLPPIPRVASRVERGGSGPRVASSQRPASRQVQHDEENRHPGGEHPTSAGADTTHRPQGQPLVQAAQRGPPPDTPPAASSSLLSQSHLSANYASHSRSQTSLLGGLNDKLSTTPKMLNPPTAPPPKSGKSRLALRNPMSLLMRRKSAQLVQALAEESLVSHLSPSLVPPIPDNYDPSIRGRIVHDFSAPRPNRNYSYNSTHGGDGDKPGAEQLATDPGRTSPLKIDREHTPVFREHFDDETSYEQSQAAIRAENLANKDFIARNSWQPPPPPPGRSPPPPPPLPKDSPPPPPPQLTVPDLPISEHHVTVDSSPLSPVQEAPSPTNEHAEVTPRKGKSTKTPPPPRSRATSINDPSFAPVGLPAQLAHHTSKSSRFSFQIAGNDSAQEKILEERHMKKAAEKASKQVRMSTNTLDDEYDGYGMDDYDMEDGFEEEIPMVGDDGFDEEIPMVGGYAFDEEIPIVGGDGFGNQSMSPGMSAFDFSALSLQANNTMALSPMNTNGGLATPFDANGNPIGFAMSENMMPKVNIAPVDNTGLPISQTSGLGLSNGHGGLGISSDPISGSTIGGAVAGDSQRQNLDLGDDLYFDDGEIEEQGNTEAVEFNEDVFDDPSGPLFERKVRSPSAEDRRTALHSNPPEILSPDTGYDADEDDLTRRLSHSENSLAHTTSMVHRRPVANLSDINAYHRALADATNLAEAQGRFARKASVASGQSSDVDVSSPLSNSRPSLVPDDGPASQETAGHPTDDDIFGMTSGFVDDYDYSDYDSALEDDPMIAAANAEALANDYEGFYGQEFGFYANAQGEALNAYGGYFGTPAIGRNPSGRNAVREPNLTPITERSEYSTRNSFISLNHFRDGQVPLQSPGLAQLARMSPYGWADDDSDMNFDALRKLRKGAFGGATSLGSSAGNSPRNSSPMGMQYVPRTASSMANYPTSLNESPDALENGGSGILEQDESEDYSDEIAAANAFPEDYEDEDNDYVGSKPESPTLTASDYNSISSPSTREDIPTFTLQQQQQQVFQTLSQSLTLSTTFQPLVAHSGDTSLPSPLPASATGSTPLRQSLVLGSSVSTTSPVTPGGGWKAPATHSRKASTADSVAYVREQDEMGGDRWVLERRRTAESGELELVGREIVEGGRI